jgi:hypothetical protein
MFGKTCRDQVRIDFNTVVFAYLNLRRPIFSKLISVCKAEDFATITSTEAHDSDTIKMCYLRLLVYINNVRSLY